MLLNFSFRVPQENNYRILPPVIKSKKDACLAVAVVTSIEARIRLRKMREGGDFETQLCYQDLHRRFVHTLDDPKVETPQEMLKWINESGLSEEPYYRWPRKICKMFPKIHFHHRILPVFRRYNRLRQALICEAERNYRKSRRHRIHSWIQYAPSDVQNIAQELRRHGPLVAGFILREDYPLRPGVTSVYRGRKRIMRATTGEVMGHAICIVGYGLRNGRIVYWITMNCWGNEWGADGFGRMEPQTLDVVFAPRVYRPRKTKKVPNPTWMDADHVFIRDRLL